MKKFVAACLSTIFAASTRNRYLMKSVVIVLSLFSLSSCSVNLEGIYHCNNSFLTSLEFESGGNMYATVLGRKIKGTYEVNGTELRTQGNRGTQIYQIVDERTISTVSRGTSIVCKKAEK